MVGAAPRVPDPAHDLVQVSALAAGADGRRLAGDEGGLADAHGVPRLVLLGTAAGAPPDPVGRAEGPVDLAHRRHALRIQHKLSLEPQRADPRPAADVAARIGGMGAGAKGRGRGQQRHAAALGLQVARLAGLAQRHAATGEDEAPGPQLGHGVDEALHHEVGGVVGRHVEEVEPHPAQLIQDEGVAAQPHAAGLGPRHEGPAGGRELQVRERGVALAHQRDEVGEGRILQVGEPPRDDGVSGGDHRERGHVREPPLWAVLRPTACRILAPALPRPPPAWQSERVGTYQESKQPDLACPAVAATVPAWPDGVACHREVAAVTRPWR